MDMLTNYLSNFGELPAEFIEDLTRTVKLNVFEKGHYLLKAGNVCDQMHFIEKGCVQCYLGTKYKKETLWFMAEGELAIFKKSFYDQVKSEASIVALEETRTYSIYYPDLEQLYKDHLFLERVGRKITEYYHKRSDIKSYALYPNSPTKRLERFHKHCPQIVERVPGKYLASLLGMTAETFSRRLSAKRIKG